MKRIAAIVLIFIFVIDGKAQTLLPFKIIEEKDVSYAGTPRLVVRVVVDVEKIPNKAELKRIANSIWKSGNNRWAEFTVFLYLPEMNIHSIAYGIGEYRPSGLKEFNIQEIALFGTKWHKAKKDIVDSIIESSRTKEYSITLDTDVKGRTLSINVKTNLPDGAKILIGVKRIYWQNGEDAKYSGEIYSQDIAVKDGRIKVTTKIDDFRWKLEYKEKQIQFKQLNLFTGIRKVSPKIDVSAMFSPRRNRGNSVLDILGKDGEFMSGKNIQNSYGFNILEATKEIKIRVE
ncbi:MAG: hypothetical protein IIB94_14635 [Candidatus Marinimicrobia bacterium]|nr:hypothetical protein [Candidatus Neomarinimicrobiota bacterium]